MPIVADVIDLFAGCGGFTAGFQAVEGFRPIAAIEHDPAAAATYAENFGRAHTHCMDISSFRHIPAADVVIGGPPCQGFSALETR